MSEDDRARVAARLVLVLKIVGIFLLVYPPVGTVLYFTFAALTDTFQTKFELLQAIQVIWFMLTYGVPMGYLILAAPAVLAGLVIGGWQAFYGAMHGLLVLLVGAGVGAVFQMVFGLTMRISDAVTSNEIVVISLMIAAWVCWRIVRKRPVPGGALA